MNYNFANKMDQVKFSAIRAVLARANGNGQYSDAISFAGGFPDPNAIPKDQLVSIAHEVFSKNPDDILKYGDAQGYPGLMASAKEFLNKYDFICKESDDILITTGSQQGLDLTSTIFIDEGDTIVVEDPSFLGAFNCFRCNGARLIGVPLEEDGVDLKELEKAFQTKPTPKLFYIIPNFQNPTGITTSLEKRKAIYDLACQYGVVILEDNPYGYLRTSGNDVPSIKSFDEKGMVIYTSSFSKIISPGMRAGLLVGQKELISKIKMAKQVNDNHTNSLSQYTIDGFLRTVDMDEHISKLRDMYSEKCHYMLKMMKKYFHPRISFVEPEGGMFVWFDLPDDVNMLDFVEAAVEKHIAIVPGNEFHVDSSKSCQSIRMNFSLPSLEEIEKGIKILGELTYQFCK